MSPPPKFKARGIAGPDGTGRTRSAHRGQLGSIHPFIIMTKLELKGDWNITMGKLKQRWAQLTHDDLQLVEGQQEELLGRIQKRTGETREAIVKAIQESSSTCCP
jgi:uncharacterized protein YjbJ (UPF0337 family)